MKKCIELCKENALELYMKNLISRATYYRVSLPGELAKKNKEFYNHRNSKIKKSFLEYPEETTTQERFYDLADRFSLAWTTIRNIIYSKNQ